MQQINDLIPAGPTPQERIQKLADRVTIPSRISEPSDDREGCADCFYTGMVLVEGEGARNCECRKRAQLQRFYDQIPTEFGVPTFDTFKPDRGRHPSQAEKFEQLRREPALSYFLCGDNGTGKTYFGWLLAVEAYRAGRKVVAVELDTLLKQYRRWQFICDEPDAQFRDDRPAVLPADLKQKGVRHTIFLDEIGGTKVTEYAAQEFFYLLKAAAEYDHQMILTCDVQPSELADIWRNVQRKGNDEVPASDAHWGNKIARRIAEYSVRVDLFRPAK